MCKLEIHCLYTTCISLSRLLKLSKKKNTQKTVSDNRSPSRQELLNHSAVQLRASDSGLVKPDCSGHCWARVLWQAPFHCLKFSQATARPVCLFHMTDSQLCAFVSLCLSARQVRLSEGEEKETQKTSSGVLLFFLAVTVQL